MIGCGFVSEEFAVVVGSVEFYEATPMGLVDDPKNPVRERVYRCVTCFYFIFSGRAASGGGGGGERCQTFSFVPFSLFSRPRAGLATM